MNWCWCMSLSIGLWLTSGVVRAEVQVHRYLHTLETEYGLLDLVRNKQFFTPLARLLGASIEHVGQQRPPAVAWHNLMQEPAYRAYASRYAVMGMHVLYMQELAQQQNKDALHTELNDCYALLAQTCFEQVPVFMAIDGDFDFATLTERFHHTLFSSRISIYPLTDISDALYSSTADEEEGDITVKMVKFAHHGSYLLRSNRVKHKALLPAVVAELRQLNWQDEQIAMMPYDFAVEIIHEELTPQLLDSIAKGLDLAIVIDLTTEGMVFANFILSLGQVMRLSRGHMPLKQMLGRELLLDPNREDFDQQFAAAVAVLNDPDQPATLAQLVQLIKLGYSLDEIKALTYSGRDAIIVTNPVDKSEFEQQFADPTVDEINSIAAERGPLYFYLLALGLAAEDIKPHHPSLLAAYP